MVIPPLLDLQPAVAFPVLLETRQRGDLAPQREEMTWRPAPRGGTREGRHLGAQGGGGQGAAAAGRGGGARRSGKEVEAQWGGEGLLQWRRYSACYSSMAAPLHLDGCPNGLRCCGLSAHSPGFLTYARIPLNLLLNRFSN